MYTRSGNTQSEAYRDHPHMALFSGLCLVVGQLTMTRSWIPRRLQPRASHQFRSIYEASSTCWTVSFLRFNSQGLPVCCSSLLGWYAEEKTSDLVHETAVDSSSDPSHLVFLKGDHRYAPKLPSAASPSLNHHEQGKMNALSMTSSLTCAGPARARRRGMTPRHIRLQASHPR